MLLGLPWYTWVGVGIPFILTTFLPAFLVIMLTRKRRNKHNV